MDGQKLGSTSMTIHAREPELRELLAEISGRKTASLAPDDDIIAVLGLDSLAGLRLLAAIEKRFDVRFPDERLSEFRTLRALLEVVGDGGST
jgi:acyl carrier protein